MITLRRAGDRRHVRLQKQQIWITFRQDRSDPLSEGFATLESLSENLLPPGAGATRLPNNEAEIVTYVRKGELNYKDSLGRSGVIHTGEFQSMTAGRGISRSEANASKAHWVHSFQVRLRLPEAGVESGLEQKRFSAAERRGRLCVVASPDGRRGSLPIHQDTLMYSALLDPGQHLVHEIFQGRSVWLHLAQGEVTLSDAILVTGDGVGVWAERAVSLTARLRTEILLIDLGEQPSRDDSRTFPVHMPRSLHSAHPPLDSIRGAA